MTMDGWLLFNGRTS